VTFARRVDRGRPLRFLGAVAVGWIGLRVAMLLPEPEPPLTTAARARVPMPPASHPVIAMKGRIATPRGAGRTEVTRGGSMVGHRPNALRPPRPQRHPEHVSGPTAQQGQYGEDARWMLRQVQHDGAVDEAVRDQDASQMLGPVRHDGGAGKPVDNPARHKRWSVSAWAVARAGLGQEQAVTGGQLGGSQAGIRVVRSLDRRARFALSGRVTTPLGAGLREASAGLEWQPTRLPVKLVAEHRFVLGRGNGGPGVAVIGGFGPTAPRYGLRTEAYGQAGAIRRARIESYADAAVRVTHRIGHFGRVAVDLGAGAWGGAQRGAARFDLGPSLVLAMPVHRAALRLTLDWRERVAGRARPGAGPALTLGTDF